MLARKVAVLNRSTVVTDSELEHIVDALEHDQQRHFGPAWGTAARLTFIPSGQDTGWEDKWNVIVLDTSDEANALGYHDLTPEGLPLGKAFAKTDQLVGAQLSVTVDHELKEMLGDPEINLTADGNGVLYAYENCDAVEADELGYQVGDVLCSNFVRRPWFVASLRGRQDIQFDHGRVLSRPFQLAPGGYISYTATWPPSWQQAYAEGHAPDPLARPRLGSRRERRATPREHWQRSRS